MSPVNQKKLQPGDLIEIFHIGYKHWAVYIGDGFVVHMTLPNGSSASSGSSSGGLTITRALVKKEKLKYVVGDNKWVINNLMDGKKQPRDAKVIVKEALQLVGTKPVYNLFFNNCEHFATGLRYGRRLSRQAVIGAVRLCFVVMSPLAAAAGVVGVAITGLGWFGCEVLKKIDDKVSKPKTPWIRV